MREPDAGNPHVRFDEGEGGCQWWHPPLYATGLALNENSRPIKESVLKKLRAGKILKEIAEVVGRTSQTLSIWRGKDAAFDIEVIALSKTHRKGRREPVAKRTRKPCQITPPDRTPLTRFREVNSNVEMRFHLLYF